MGNQVKVLVACEYSGIVRDAFIARGHEAMSCDILPTESPGPHYQGDVRDVLDGGWDLMVAHPPCTYLANSGVRWLYGGKGTVRDPARWHAMRQAGDFFSTLLTANVPRVAVENPVMHRWGTGVIDANAFMARITYHRQIIQPWQFGHGETKATCLWLKGLPLLRPTDIVPGREQRIWKMAPSPNRWRERSRTFPGIAEAMADQWGGTVQLEMLA
jgi:hypothetical protein